MVQSVERVWLKIEIYGTLPHSQDLEEGRKSLWQPWLWVGCGWTEGGLCKIMLENDNRGNEGGSQCPKGMSFLFCSLSCPDCTSPAVPRLFQMIELQQVQTCERVTEVFGRGSHFRDGFQGEMKVTVCKCYLWGGGVADKGTGIGVCISCSCFLNWHPLGVSGSLGQSALCCLLCNFLNYVCGTCSMEPSVL